LPSTEISPASRSTTARSTAGTASTAFVTVWAQWPQVNGGKVKMETAGERRTHSGTRLSSGMTVGCEAARRCDPSCAFEIKHLRRRSAPELRTLSNRGRLPSRDPKAGKLGLDNQAIGEWR
jgi:hypothetical protein